MRLQNISFKLSIIFFSFLSLNLCIAQVSLLKDIRTGNGNSFMEKPVVFNNKIYFQASGDTFAETGLYETDGTPLGTILIEGNTSSDELTSATNFMAWSGPPPSGTGTRAWRYISGVKEYPGNSNIYCSTLFHYNNEVFYNGSTFSNGSELWKVKSFGSPEAVVELPSTSSPSSLNPSGFINHSDGAFYFLSWRNNGSCSIWRSTGETGNTNKIIDSPYVRELYSVGSFVYFFYRDTAPFFSGLKQLWVTDGTTAGTIEIKDFGAGFPVTTEYASVNNNFYFFAPEADSTYELWQSNGTSVGTVPVSNIDINGGFPTFLGTVGDELFFTADKAGMGPVLYKYNESLNMISLVMDINGLSNTSGYMGKGVAFLNKLYFTADDGVNGIELWRTDGTAAGTEMVEDINPVGNSEVDYLTVLGNRLVFVANEPINGYEPRVYTDPLNPPCSSIVSLSGISSEPLYEASVSIESTQEIPSSFSTSYHSPSIELKAGFVTNNASVFRAEALNCF